MKCGRVLGTEKNEAERDVLLWEVHHRVRNNLTQISSALSVQAHRTPEPDAAGGALPVSF